MKRYLHTTIKMLAAGALTTLIAYRLGLDYPITGGLLAVLSIQLTRTDSFLLAGKRLANTVWALALASVLFLLLEYNVWVFLLFAALFIATSFLLRFHEGIVPSLVLANHLLDHGAFSLEVLLNSFLLMFTAVAMALIVNLVYPIKARKLLKNYTEQLDTLIKEDLITMTELLKALPEGDKYFKEHQERNRILKTILKEAHWLEKDILLEKNRRPIQYLYMRDNQMKHVDRIFNIASEIQSYHTHAEIMSDYMENLAKDIGRTDKATGQLEELNRLLEQYRNRPLPKTRKEFETRAKLYQIMFEIEAFLREKIAFHEQYSSETVFP